MKIVRKEILKKVQNKLYIHSYHFENMIIPKKDLIFIAGVLKIHFEFSEK